VQDEFQQETVTKISRVVSEKFLGYICLQFKNGIEHKIPFLLLLTDRDKSSSHSQIQAEYLKRELCLYIELHLPFPPLALSQPTLQFSINERIKRKPIICKCSQQKKFVLVLFESNYYHCTAIFSCFSSHSFFISTNSL
jgi:hypothetical protein